MLVCLRPHELKYTGKIDKNVKYHNIYNETCGEDPNTEMKILEEAWKANDKIVNRDILRILIRSIAGLGMMVTNQSSKLVRFIHSLRVNELGEIIGIEGDLIVSEAIVIEITNDMLHETLFETGTINELYDLYKGRSIYGEETEHHAPSPASSTNLKDDGV